MNSAQGYKGFITFLLIVGILFTVLFGFNYISQTQNTEIKASVPKVSPLNVLVQNITETSAEITWTTEDTSQGIVTFTMSDIKCADNNSTCTDVKEAEQTKSHSIRLINLNSNTEYFFYLKMADGKYFPEDKALKFVTKELVEPTSQIKQSIVEGFTNPSDSNSDFEGILVDEPEQSTQPTFDSLINNESPVLGKNTNIIDQMVVKEFKDAVIFNDTKYDFNKDGSVTVADYPLFIKFINNPED